MAVGDLFDPKILFEINVLIQNEYTPFCRTPKTPLQASLAIQIKTNHREPEAIFA